MATTVIKTAFQFRRGTEEEWAQVNSVLRQGEPGFVTDKNKLKIGDGTTTWNNLEYQNGEEYVVNKETHYDFPSVGKENVIYKASAEKKIYQWNPTSLVYEPLDTGGVSEIEIINGGNANGNA